MTQDDVTPDTLSPDELGHDRSVGYARELVDVNQQNVQGFSIPMLDAATGMVVDNEDQLSEVYRPLVKDGTKRVKKIEKELDELITVLMDWATQQVSVNDGQIKNYGRSIHKGRSDASVNRNPVIEPTRQPAESLTDTSNKQLLGSVPTVSANRPPIMQSGAGSFIGGSGTAGVSATPPNGGVQTNDIYVPPVSGGTGTTLNGSGTTFSGTGSSADTLPVLLEAPTVSNGSTGGGVALDQKDAIPPPVVINPDCTDGVWIWIDPPGEYRCFQCPPGWDVDIATGKCKPKPKPRPIPCPVEPPIIPPGPGPEVPPCPPPTEVCPPGTKPWWDPVNKVWKCTEDGGPPKPPPGKPPDCQTLMDRIQPVMLLDCNRFPKEFQDQLQACGYKLCKQGDQEDDDQTPLGPQYNTWSQWIIDRYGGSFF